MNKRTYHSFATALVATIVLLTIAGCSGRAPSPTPHPSVIPPFSREEIAPDEAIVDVGADKGSTITLQDGAQATLPAGALAQDATVTFRTALEMPGVGIPASIVGAAYEVIIEGSELTGVIRLRLPLPPGVTPDQYELAPHRWTGRTWERVTALDATGGIQFGVNTPGVFAILGRWRLADATLALVKPETVPGQQSIPLTVVGQYRFSAIPALQDDLVPVTLTLKQDTSGGAGLVAGNPNQDTTVDEARLWFKPDPAQSQGVIEFTHVFDLLPGLLNLDPGVNTRFYAVLTVDDAATPTRRISTGIDYTQILPIQIQNMEVVRPIVLQEDRLDLRWKVMLNGLTFQTPDAASATLALQPIIDLGGVGDYQIVLEVAREGEWMAVSNEVSIQLAVRETATPLPGLAPVGTPAIIAGPTPSDIQPPTVPTRRPTPVTSAQNRVTPTVSPSPTIAVTPTATRPDWASTFWADSYAVTPPECTIIHWQVQDVITVFYQGQPVTGNETRQECPTQTTTYTLRTTSTAGTQDRTVTIQVAAAGEPAIVFMADKLQLASGECTMLRWSVTDVKEVRLNDAGVGGIESREECLNQTTEYVLTVLDNAGKTTTKRLTITVTQGSSVATGATFWAEQYTMPPNGCTMLHWNVQGVRTVFLGDEGAEGEGSKQACPGSTPETFSLIITGNDGSVTSKDLVLVSGDPGLGPLEIIGQGLVNSATSRADINELEQGDQPGYDIVIDGLRVLFAGTPGFSQATVTLRIAQLAIELGEDRTVHWPMRSGQQVEFRSTCNGANCTFDYASDAYLYWRSQ